MSTFRELQTKDGMQRSLKSIQRMLSSAWIKNKAKKKRSNDLLKLRLTTLSSEEADALLDAVEQIRN